MATKEIDTAPQRRAKRTPIGQRNRLDFQNLDPAYHYRLVNCNNEKDPFRVEQFKGNDWEIAPESSAAPAGVDAGGHGKEINVGSGQRAVLMRIRKEWYEEDQKSKLQKADDQESGIYAHQKENGLRGEIKIERK